MKIAVTVLPLSQSTLCLLLVRDPSAVRTILTAPLIQSWAAKLTALLVVASAFAMVYSNVLAQPGEIPETALVDPQACAMPAPSDGATVVLLGTFQGDAVSTTAIGSQDVAIKTASIVIEPGREPIYVVVTSVAPTIWRVSGAVERLERLVLSAVRNGPGGASIPDQPPLVGATGVPEGKITFLKQVDCGLTLTDASSRESTDAVNAVVRETGRAPAVVAADFDVAGFSVPSGQIRTTRPTGDRLVIIPGQCCPTIKGDTVVSSGDVVVSSGEVVILTGEMEILQHELRSFHPGGVIEIDPSDVVATQPATRYEVLPSIAGLIQLVQAGALKQTRYAEFLVMRKIRMPTEVPGYTFTLLPGVPEPDGRIGDARVVR